MRIKEPHYVFTGSIEDVARFYNKFNVTGMTLTEGVFGEKLLKIEFYGKENEEES